MKIIDDFILNYTILIFVVAIVMIIVSLRSAFFYSLRARERIKHFKRTGKITGCSHGSEGRIFRDGVISCQKCGEKIGSYLVKNENEK